MRTQFAIYNICSVALLCGVIGCGTTTSTVSTSTRQTETGGPAPGEPESHGSFSARAGLTLGTHSPPFSAPAKPDATAAVGSRLEGKRFTAKTHEGRLTTTIVISEFRDEPPIMSFKSTATGETLDGVYKTTYLLSAHHADLIASVSKIDFGPYGSVQFKVISQGERKVFDLTEIVEGSGFYADEVGPRQQQSGKGEFFGFPFHNLREAREFEQLWKDYLAEKRKEAATQATLVAEQDKRNELKAKLLDQSSAEAKLAASRPLPRGTFPDPASDFRNTLGNLKVGTMLYRKADLTPYGFVTDIEWGRVKVALKSAVSLGVGGVSIYGVWFDKSYVTKNFWVKID